jgi:hypothetical protein
MIDSARATASEATHADAGVDASSQAGSAPVVGPRKVGTKSAIIGAVGAVLVLAAAGLVGMKYDVSFGGMSSVQPTISSVDQDDLDAASNTLTPAVAGGLIDDAKHCRVPLASMTIAKGTAQAGGSIRIRSGSYLSPWFNVADDIRRIAIPYPSPYGSGSGVLVVEGDATGVILGLTPTKVILGLPTAESIPVVWRPRSLC